MGVFASVRRINDLLLITIEALRLLEEEEEKECAEYTADRKDEEGSPVTQLVKHRVRGERQDEDAAPEDANSDRESLIAGNLSKVDPRVCAKRQLEHEQE